ncbi:hypothetical protein ABL78_4115 [Leptomonas seymouri]|uniref:Uncharacterized protein n=1 Tax=Leptomonas seymouri TaxID=5684 RepID=A0A0N1HX36_LEPSE|nr:hypothetical protein ABL78_4115 [Leptomonas seymouri]|eukprot:KPI86838.1 hypothetical protein ABL78_4115 [Leptomonas seymouri]
MGGSCCTARSKGDATHTKKSGNAAADSAFQDIPARALRVQPVAFDVFVPENTSPAGADVKLYEPNSFANANGTLFDASMHTVRDMSMAVDRNISFDPLARTMNNMSFTNSFKAVNKSAVQVFMKNIARLAGQDIGNQSLLAESLIGPNAVMDNKSTMLDGHAPNSTITQEDLNYIVGGVTLPDRLMRLQEVESVLRQTIEGTWMMDSTLLQLARCQVMPTLRQRRRQWNAMAQAGPNQTPANAQTTTAINTAPMHPSRQPVLVIHAPGVQMDRSLSMIGSGSLKPGMQAPDTASSNRTNRPDYSPPSAPDFSAASGKEAPLEMSASRSRLEPPPRSKVEQYELLALTARDVDARKCPGAHVESDTWDFLATEKGTSALNEGKCIFRFMSSPLAGVDAETKAIMEPVVNLSLFKDEVTENNTPKVDVNDPDDASKYIAILVKTMYLLPGIAVQDITKDLVASTDFQKACQPSENQVLDCEFEDTFRLSISIIRFIFSLTIQFRVWEISDPAVLESLAVCDGMVPAKAIVLERTKRHIAKTDATAKVRSILLYYPVNDGVLVDNFTIALNTSLPRVASKVMNTFGSQGAAQSVTTTKLTREYMVKHFGDSRAKKA